jgi:ATPase family AAA domain-containing protein 3A/B
VIIIDEIELLALDRSNEKGSDEMRTLLNTLLTYTGDAESRDYMVIGLTNRKKDLDPAFLKRCDDRIRIDVPGPVERRALIELYVGKYLLRAENLLQKDPSVVSRAYWLGQSSIEKPRIEQGALTPGELDKLSERLVGFVGRDIVQLVKQIQSSALASDNNLITKDLIERVVVTKIAEQEADHETLALPR